MKKILILTAGYGEGHNTAARSLREALEREGGETLEVEVLDVMALTYGRANEWLRKAYMKVIAHAPGLWERVYQWMDNGTGMEDQGALLAPMRRRLARILEEAQPLAVVSTYPIYNYLMGPKPLPFWQVTLITDSITVNSIWHRCGSDYFIVPNEATAAVLATREVGPVKTLGFPVSLRFEARRPKAPPAAGERWKVLYMINAGKREAPELVRGLLKREGIELKVTVGRDEALRRAVESVVARSGREVEVIGWTDRMPELILEAHLLIGKAGGATVQETLAAATPMLVTQVVPGQEEGNARLLLENGCGALAQTPEAISEAVDAAFADGGALWRQWYEAAERLGLPDAGREVSRFLLGLSGKTGQSGAL